MLSSTNKLQVCPILQHLNPDTFIFSKIFEEIHGMILLGDSSSGPSWKVVESHIV